MQKITSLLHQLAAEDSLAPLLKNLTLKKGEIFSWDHTARVLTYDPDALHAGAYLLHELSHALLDHSRYTRDTQLLEMERAAWDKATELASNFSVEIEEDFVEDTLDTYRDWLHARSICPNCDATGIQTSAGEYRCVACSTLWHVNEARTCALRRHKTPKKHSS